MPSNNPGDLILLIAFSALMAYSKASPHHPTDLTVVLVLVQPLVAVIREQLVLAEGGVDKAVDKGGGQVHTGRVHLGAAATEPWARTHTNILSEQGFS